METLPDKIHVLHVEDDEEFAELAAHFLERNGYELSVKTAGDAEEALGYLAEQSFDCVVSDYRMPGLSGIEFLEEIRDEHPDLPFVLFTGQGSEEVASEAISEGVSDYLQKQTGTEQFELLANRIRNAVEKKYAQSNYSELFEKISAGATIIDPETGAIEEANQRFAEMLDRDVEDVVGRRPAELSPDEPPFSHERASRLLRETEDEDTRTFEWKYLRDDGQEVWVEVTLTPTQLNDRDRMLAIVREIS